MTSTSLQQEMVNIVEQIDERLHKIDDDLKTVDTLVINDLDELVKKQKSSLNQVLTPQTIDIFKKRHLNRLIQKKTSSLRKAYNELEIIRKEVISAAQTLSYPNLD